MLFAWKTVKSNTIVYAHGTQIVGITIVFTGMRHFRH